MRASEFPKFAPGQKIVHLVLPSKLAHRALQFPRVVSQLS